MVRNYGFFCKPVEMQSYKYLNTNGIFNRSNHIIYTYIIEIEF